MRTATVLLAIGLMAAGVPCFAEKTEYAFRWNPDQAGPRTAAEAAGKLQIKDNKPQHFQVRYLSVKQSPVLPGPDFQVVARERTGKDGPEAMYKVRGTDSDQARNLLSRWSCPLQGQPEQKLEVDVNWVLDEKNPQAPPVAVSAISYSCSVEGPASAAFPGELGMSPKPCINEVQRLRQDDKAKNQAWKLEEWKLPTGGRIVELSYSVDAGSPAHMAAFQEKVDLLRKAHAVPLPGSKTLLGSTCPTSPVGAPGSK